MQYTFTFGPSITTASAAYQMFAQAGLFLSQVVTLLIDNTMNSAAVTVTHGVLNIATSVDAGQAALVPTFSNTGPYNVVIQCLSTPTDTGYTTLTYLNYEKNPTSWSLTAAQASQTPGALYSAEVDITANGTTLILPNGQYSISSIELSLISVTATSSGTYRGTFTLKQGSTNIGSIAYNFNSTGANIYNPTVSPFTTSNQFSINNNMTLVTTNWTTGSGSGTAALHLTVLGTQIT